MPRDSHPDQSGKVCQRNGRHISDCEEAELCGNCGGEDVEPRRVCAVGTCRRPATVTLVRTDGSGGKLVLCERHRGTFEVVAMGYTLTSDEQSAKGDTDGTP